MGLKSVNYVVYLLKYLENERWLIAKHIQGLKPKTSKIAVLSSVGLNFH